MNIQEAHNFLRDYYSKEEILSMTGNVLDNVASDVLRAVLSDDLLEAGRIIKDALEDVLADEARGIEMDNEFEGAA